MKRLITLLFALASCQLFAQKISDLPAATTLNGTELVPVVQTTSKKATISLIRGFSSFGTTGQLLRVNGAGTGLEFFTPAYLTSETDPVYSASSWFGTTNNSSNWNTAFGWGNHAGLYPLLAGSYADPSWITELSAAKLTGSINLADGFDLPLSGINASLSSDGFLKNVGGSVSPFTLEFGDGLIDASGTISWGGTVTSDKTLDFSSFNLAFKDYTALSSVGETFFIRGQVSTERALIRNTNNFIEISSGIEAGTDSTKIDVSYLGMNVNGYGDDWEGIKYNATPDIIEDHTLFSRVMGDARWVQNPMTSAGDIIYGGAVGVPTRLAAGTNGHVLTLSGGVPVWAAPSGSGYTDEQAQDAVGAMVDATLTYVDGTPSLSRAALTGAITASAGSNTTALGSFTTSQLNTALSDNDVATGGGTATGTNTGDQTITLTGDVTGSGTGSFAATIANDAVTLAKMANMATSSLIYRKTAGTGDPEVNTLATLKTDILTGGLTIPGTPQITFSTAGDFIIPNGQTNAISFTDGVDDIFEINTTDNRIDAAYPFHNATFTGTFDAANGSIASADLANSAVASLSGTNTGDQSLSHGSDATSHTATLSASGGSLKLIEGSNVTLTTSGNEVTIASSGGGGATDLAFTGSSSPVTLTSSTGTDVTFTAGTNVTLSATGSNITINASGGGGGGGERTITFVLNEGPTVSTGGKNYTRVIAPFTGTIVRWKLIADASSTVTVDVWKDTAIPTNSNTITASAKPALSSAAFNSSSTLTGWTTSVTEGDILMMEVESATGCNYLALTLVVAL